MTTRVELLGLEVVWMIALEEEAVQLLLVPVTDWLRMSRLGWAAGSTGLGREVTLLNI